MKKVKVPDEITYAGVFLTHRCNFDCSYCINKHGTFVKYPELMPDQWLEGLNRLQIDKKLMVPLTLQGGEPSLSKGFIEIINKLDKSFYIDILTNLSFDIDKFMDKVDPQRLQRDVPYPSIRVSFHPQFHDFEELAQKVYKMDQAGYSIGIFIVDHPMIDVGYYKALANAWGIDFRTKEFLGRYKGELYGEYKYPNAVDGKGQRVQCKSNELLIAPNGDIFKCHKDLYAGQNALANIRDKEPKIEFKFRECESGACNPCDIKIKNNRFQEFGSCAVEIIDG